MLGNYYIIDIIIFLILICGAIIGFKQGAIKTAAKLIGTFGAIVVAYYLKNPISVLLYSNLPFFDFKGLLNGVSVLNILVYEAIAYLLIFLVLYFVFKGIIFFSGIIEKILKATIVLGFISKLLGIVVGALSAYLFIFILAFAYNQYALINDLDYGSKYQPVILNETPILSKGVEKTQNNLTEIINLKEDYQNTDSRLEFNTKALTILLKNKTITKTSASQLIDKGKIVINENDAEIKKYLD